MIELGHVTDRKPPFKYSAYVRVGFSDTDAQGVVYYGRYMPYFDLARTEVPVGLGARESEVRHVAPVVDDALGIGVGEPDAHVGRVLERRLPPSNVPKLDHRPILAP